MNSPVTHGHLDKLIEGQILHVIRGEIVDRSLIFDQEFFALDIR